MLPSFEMKYAVLKSWNSLWESLRMLLPGDEKLLPPGVAAGCLSTNVPGTMHTLSSWANLQYRSR